MLQTHNEYHTACSAIHIDSPLGPGLAWIYPETQAS